MIANAESADSSANEAAKELMNPPGETAGRHPWNASADLTWLPGSDIKGTGGKLGMQEFESRFGRSCLISPKLSIATDFAYSLKSIDAPASARLPESLHTLSVGLTGNYQVKENLGLTLLVRPSLNGDFKSIGTEDIRTQIGMLGMYHSSQKLTFLAGLIYLQGNEAIPVLPVVGVIYRPNEQWTFSTVAPRPSIKFSPNRTSSYYIGGEFSGTEYRLHDDSLDAEEIRYRDLRALAGAEFLLFSALKLDLAGGYAFDRKFVFYDSSRSDVSIDDGPFAKLGLSLVW